MSLKGGWLATKSETGPDAASIPQPYSHALLQLKNAFGSPKLDLFPNLHHVFFLLSLLSLSDVSCKIFSAKRASFICVKYHENLGWYVNI